MQKPCHVKLLKLKDLATEHLANSRDFRELAGRVRESEGEGGSDLLEAELVDLERSNLRFQRGCRHTELGCRTQLPRDAARGRGQRRLNGFLLFGAGLPAIWPAVQARSGGF